MLARCALDMVRSGGALGRHYAPRAGTALANRLKVTAQYVDTSFADPMELMKNATAGDSQETVAPPAPPPPKSGYKRGRPLRLFKKGSPLLQDSIYNKGVAFPAFERERLGLRGLLPVGHYDLQTQFNRVMLRYRTLESGGVSASELWTALTSVKSRNSVLYYKVLMENFQSMSPIVYTPTIGEICQNWHHHWRPGRDREMYFSLQDKGDMVSMVYNYPEDEVDLVVVTDGSRVLGLGDLGMNGAGICIGKMDLYIAGGGFAPSRVLPVALDFGTDNETLRNDPFYLGTPQKRPVGEEMYGLIDEFMKAVRRRYPYALIHFEDFETEKARELLRRYRHDSFVFNDDIQGTAAVTLAAFLAYARASNTDLGELRIVCAGAGSSALGILGLTAKYIAEQTGCFEDEARAKFFVLDSKGLIGQDRPGLGGEKAGFAAAAPDGLSLLETVKLAKPHVLFGCSTIGGMFTHEILEEVAKHHGTPLIMPLSNPTSKAECTIDAAVAATKGRLMFASGSPFKDTPTEDGRVVYGNQCNNAFIFPGLAMGAILSGATRVNDEMLMTAAERLSECMSEDDAAVGKLFPRVENIRGVSEVITAAVARCAVDTRVASGGTRGIDWLAEDVVEKIRPYLWEPEYVTYIDNTWTRDASSV